MATNPFAESFARFILIGELPPAEKMREEIEEYERQKKEQQK